MPDPPLALRVGNSGKLQLRWLLLGGLLVVELLAMSWRFDTKTLLEDFGSWAPTLGGVHHLVHLAIAVVVGIAIFGGATFAEKFRQLAQNRDLHHSRWRFFFAAHILGFTVWYWLSIQLFEGRSGQSRDAAVWLVAWMVVGLSTLLLWLATLLPPGELMALSFRSRGMLLVAGAVGAAAVAMGIVTASLWNPLGGWTLAAVQCFTSFIYGNSAYCDFSRYRIATDRFWIEVSPACSGYEGIGLIWVFLAVFLWHYRRTLRFPHALLLFPLGTAIIWLANVLRITGLFMIGQTRPDVALAGFHSQAGWLAFNAVSLALLAASRHSRFFVRQEQQVGRSNASSIAIPYLAPLFILLLGTMLTHAFTIGFDRYYAVRVLVTAGVVWWFRRQYAVLRWTWLWTPVVLGVAVYGLWIALEPTSSSSVMDEETRSPFNNLDPAGAVFWLVLRIFGSVIIVPLVEELAFRGYLMRRLISKDVGDVTIGNFTWFSFLLSSVLFGALHTRWVAGSVAGMVFALALYRRGKLGDAVVAHVVANGLVALHVITTGHWSLWA